MFRLFISRPVATTLLTLAIVLAGITGLRMLPVSPLPQLDFPIIVVSASLAGASPETMATSVATPLERALGTIAGVNEMTSSSSLGNSRIIIQFDLDRNVDSAARDVQAAINAAQTLLPTGMSSRPTYRKVNPSDAPIMILSLSSDTFRPDKLYDFASTTIGQRISQLKGVGEVSIGGSSLPAVRVSVNPQLLFNKGLSLDDVRTAIAQANQHIPTGALDASHYHWQIKVNDEMKKAQDYRNIIIRHDHDGIIRLRDVADVSDSVQDVRNAGLSNNRPAVLLMIRRAKDANIIETVDRIRQQLPQLQNLLPASVKLTVAQDRSPTIRAALHEVQRTLLIAVILVVLVVFLFLRSPRITLIPAVTIPVSLIGTCAVMYLLDFSLNTLSLMALTIATGFVVDDAIVVVENISRHIEAGKSRFDAALQGIREVGFTVISMSLSLIAVFIPLLFMTGIPGRVFKEFAVTLSVTIIISLLVSLTLTPMMCAHLLTEKKNLQQKSVMAKNPLFEQLKRLYKNSLQWAIQHKKTVLTGLMLTIAFNIWLFIHIPKTLFPQQDTGRVMGFIQADQSISFQAMQHKFDTFMHIVASDPAVENVSGFTGGAKTNRGSMFISLKPLTSGRPPVNEVINRIRKKLANQAGAQLFLMPVADLRSGGRESDGSYQYSLLSDDLVLLRQWEPKIRTELAQLPELLDISSDQQDKGSEVAITYDRQIMSQLGVKASDVNALLNDAFGQRQISTIYESLNQYKVVLEVQAKYSQNITALDNLYVISQSGQPIPLSRFAKWQNINAPLSVNHQGLSAATTISFNLPDNVSLSQATQAIERTMIKLGVPASIHGTFAGTAKEFKQSQQSQLILIIAAIMTVYIVLGILYESYRHPLTILSTLPSAGIGALIALEFFSTPLSLIAMIGILLLIGIVKKNAIILVDFAIEAERKQQISAEQAILQACLLRFRPIIMTTLAAILAALPLILSQGDGAELRQPLGITIVGGLIVSQLLTLYTTPIIYLLLSGEKIHKIKSS